MWHYAYPDELLHHGIKGMKWGVRRTPKQLDHTTKDESSKKSRKDNLKKAAKIGAYTVGTVMVSYAGVKFTASPKARAAVGKVIDKIGNKKVKDAPKSMDSLSGIYSKKLGREFTIAEAVAEGLSDLI